MFSGSLVAIVTPMHLDGSIDLVLDGGTSEGIGASTIDITEMEWRVIKEGAITQKEIADCLEDSDRAAF